MVMSFVWYGFFLVNCGVDFFIDKVVILFEENKLFFVFMIMCGFYDVVG